MNTIGECKNMNFMQNKRPNTRYIFSDRAELVNEQMYKYYNRNISLEDRLHAKQMSCDFC